jgi:hypothetical protein
VCISVLDSNVDINVVDMNRSILTFSLWNREFEPSHYMATSQTLMVWQYASMKHSHMNKTGMDSMPLTKLGER